MNTRILILFALCPLFAVPAARAADDHDHDHTELGEHMEKMGGAFRRLSRQASDSTKNEESLKLVQTLKTNAEAALKLQPEKTADIPAEQREKFVSDYQAHMKTFLADLAKVEAALQAGKNDEAAALVKTLKKDQDEGHKQFQKKKEKKEKKGNNGSSS